MTQDADIAVPATSRQGKAGPYPSEATFPAHLGTIFDVDVTLDITSTAATDLDVLLVSPSGEARLIMSDAGGFGYSPTTRQVVLNDEAGELLPDEVGTAIPNGGYKPTNLSDGDADTFDAPAPASTGTSLDAFDGEAASAYGSCT